MADTQSCVAMFNPSPPSPASGDLAGHAQACSAWQQEVSMTFLPSTVFKEFTLLAPNIQSGFI
jgi:hypothetical protein